MKYDDFFSNSGDKRYHVSSYFYRVEFQQRGAPHVHSLLWLKDNKGNDATTFWEEDKTDSNDLDYFLSTLSRGIKTPTIRPSGG